MKTQEDVTSGLRTLLLGEFNLLELTRRFDTEELNAIYNVGYAFVQQNNVAQALPIFSFLAQSQPANRGYLTGLALCLQMSDRFAQALNVYALVSILHPDAHGILIEMAECEIAMNEPEAAKITLGALLETRDDIAPPIHAKAQALLNLLTSEPTP